MDHLIKHADVGGQENTFFLNVEKPTSSIFAVNPYTVLIRVKECEIQVISVK